MPPSQTAAFAEPVVALEIAYVLLPLAVIVPPVTVSEQLDVAVEIIRIVSPVPDEEIVPPDMVAWAEPSKVIAPL